MEQEAYENCDDLANVPLMSIAISLKRIADALENNPNGNYNLYDIVNKIADKL